MGHKKVCFTCRKAFSVNLIEDRPIKQVDNGFYYDHVSDNGLYVKYPLTIEEARLFVMKYKSQAYFYTEKEK